MFQGVRSLPGSRKNATSDFLPTGKKKRNEPCIYEAYFTFVTDSSQYYNGH